MKSSKKKIPILKKMWDFFTDYFSWLPIHPQYFLKKYTNTAILEANKYAKGILVDIGCGRMPYRGKLREKVKRYIGVDHPEVVKFYKGEHPPEILADATNIPLPKNFADIALLLQVIEHLPNPTAALKETARILKPKGYLVLSTVQSYPIHDEPYDYYRYTKYGLAYLLKENGFKIKSQIEEGNISTLIFQSFNVYLMLILKQLIKTPTGKIVALFLAPLILTITSLSNLLCFLTISLDQKSKFRIIQTVIAIKQ